MKPMRRQSGLTLIELMVALLIGMLLALAVFGILADFEGRKRTMTSMNDVEQSGQLALYRIDGWLRSAGSSFGQSAPYAYGCQIYASKSNTQQLPLTATPAAPFNNVGTSLYLAPAIIFPGASTPGVSGSPSDVLMIMSGSMISAAPAPSNAAPGAAALNLTESVDFAANDLVLVADQQPNVADGTLKPCLVEQISAAFVPPALPVPLLGSYYASTINTVALSSYTDATVAMRLGNLANANADPPTTLLLGVGDNDTLYTYDMLNISGTALQQQAQGVFEMHALYGVDDGAGGINWVDPNTTTTYTVAALTARTQVASALLASIKAIRVGLILRTSQQEHTSTGGNPVITPGPLKLFADLAGVTYTRALSTTEQHYRYRTMEATIPLRNNL